MRLRPEQANDEGVAILEFVIVLPLLVLILFSIFDISRYMHSYMIITQIAREGVRALSGTPELSLGFEDDMTFNPLIDIAAETGLCNNNPASASVPCGHLNAQQRMRLLYSVYDELDVEEFRAATEYSITYTATGEVDEESVNVFITADFDGMFLNGAQVSVNFRGPYLY